MMDKTDPPILSPPNGLKKLHDPKAFQNSKLAFSKELMKIPSLKNNPNSKLQTVMAFLNNGSKNKH
jgi:hypothetical protein